MGVSQSSQRELGKMIDDPEGILLEQRPAKLPSAAPRKKEHISKTMFVKGGRKLSKTDLS